MSVSGHSRTPASAKTLLLEGDTCISKRDVALGLWRRCSIKNQLSALSVMRPRSLCARQTKHTVRPALASSIADGNVTTCNWMCARRLLRIRWLDCENDRYLVFRSVKRRASHLINALRLLQCMLAGAK